MYWADKVAEQLKGKGLHHVDDMKTPSGKIHVGALRGVVIHDLVHKALLSAGEKSVYTYVFEDHDPMDDLPVYLPREKFEQYLGLPLFKIPSPEGGYENYAHYFAKDFQKVFNAIGSIPDIIWTSDLYKSEKMNDDIKRCLDKSDVIRGIYEELYKKPLASDWYPFQVYCEKCGKVSTTRVNNWDGEKVSYQCKIDAVDWTKGCGHEGIVSPFSDKDHIAGKLPWKVEWPVKWKAIGVTVEGAGKDHMSRGGSHDLARLVCERVINYPVPYPVAYEFFLVGGKKMSSSKGRGSSASSMLDILPPELLRFLMVKTDINQAINFDPEGGIIPKLFDEYQEYAEHYFNNQKDDYARIFELSQVKKDFERPPNIRFSTLAQWVQMPNMEDQIKKEGLTKWVKYAKYWVENYAFEADRFMVQQKLPEAVSSLTSSQKEYLTQIQSEIDEPLSEEELGQKIYDLAKQKNLSTKDAFSAIYLSLLGKNSGPRAASLILSLKKDFVKKRFLLQQ